MQPNSRKFHGASIRATNTAHGTIHDREAAIQARRAGIGGQASPFSEPVTVFLGVPQNESDAAAASGPGLQIAA